MSTIRQDGLKVVLPRISGLDEFWDRIHKHYAAADGQRWKLLAMLALREIAGWPLDRIGFTFEHSKGHVRRSLELVKTELRERFEREEG